MAVINAVEFENLEGVDACSTSIAPTAHFEDPKHNQHFNGCDPINMLKHKVSAP
jgi:hypothetical protein